MKIYVLCLESNVDGNIDFDVIPCKSLEIAQGEMQKQMELVLNESAHYKGMTFDEMLRDGYDIETSCYRFYVCDPYDDYWEDYHIEEKQLIEE